jgi:hypothetical protein
MSIAHPRQWSAVAPLWVVPNDGPLRPIHAKEYIYDSYKRPAPATGWTSIHLAKVGPVYTQREVIKDYNEYDPHLSNYFLQFGQNVTMANLKQANIMAFNEQAMDPGNPNIRESAREIPLFDTEDMQGLKGPPDQIILTIKAMVKRIYDLNLPKADTDRLISDMYDKFLLPMINKFPALTDPDTGAPIKDTSYLLSLAPPLVNANPTVVPVDLNKAVFTPSTASGSIRAPGGPGSSVSTTLAPIGMTTPGWIPNDVASGLNGTAPPLPPWPTPARPSLPINPPVITPRVIAPDTSSYLAESLRKKFANAIPSPDFDSSPSPSEFKAAVTKMIQPTSSGTATATPPALPATVPAGLSTPEQEKALMKSERAKLRNEARAVGADESEVDLAFKAKGDNSIRRLTALINEAKAAKAKGAKKAKEAKDSEDALAEMDRDASAHEKEAKAKAKEAKRLKEAVESKTPAQSRGRSRTKKSPKK